jgi:hypothetical protein
MLLPSIAGIDASAKFADDGAGGLIQEHMNYILSANWL